jgi:hypothetical protein
MKNSAPLAVVVVSVAWLAGLLAGSGSRAPAQPAPAGGAWEYKFLRRLATEEDFNRDGRDGWQLAGSLADERGTAMFILQRPKR